MLNLTAWPAFVPIMDKSQKSKKLAKSNSGKEAGSAKKPSAKESAKGKGDDRKSEKSKKSDTKKQKKDKAEVPKGASQPDSQVQRTVDWGAFFKSLLCACGFGLCKKKRARNDYFRPYIPAAEILAKVQADEEAKRAEEERRRLEREQVLLERKRIQGAIAVQKIIRGFLDRRRIGRQWQLAMYVLANISHFIIFTFMHTGKQQNDTGKIIGIVGGLNISD